MNVIYVSTSLLITLFLTFRFYYSQNVSLNNRILTFVFPKKAAIELSKHNKIFKWGSKNNNETKLFELAVSAEFADLLAVALVSGQNPRDSIEVISDFLPNHFRDGIQKAIRENAFGKPLMIALNEMCESSQIKVLKPLINQIETALERGTPLAEVSRVFANDQRLKFRNLLTKQAASKEVSMLFPVVFVVLPSVLAVAMYPALTVLQKLG
jgi:Flp pilus assembly protein TadB